MIQIPMKAKAPLDQGCLLQLNTPSRNSVLTAETVTALNKPASQSFYPSNSWGNCSQNTRPTATQQARTANQHTVSQQARTASQHTVSQRTRNTSQHTTPQQARVSSHPASVPPQMPLPAFTKPLRKGQKAALAAGKNLLSVRACFGWNSTNPACDVDVSAFLLGANGKVLGDSWFVFYGQAESPDRSTRFSNVQAGDREMISIDFTKLNPNVKKIVFVLTINEAFDKKLHFDMLKDAYVRILDNRNAELASFLMTDYYANVISMMIGEIYEYNGSWKFNAVGNGVAKDLAGLCALYGVQVTD